MPEDTTAEAVHSIVDKVVEILRGFGEEQRKDALKDAGKLADHARNQADIAGRKAQWAFAISIFTSVISTIFVLGSGIWTLYRSQVDEIHRLGRELRDMVVTLAAAEDAHEYGRNTNVLVKQAHEIALRLIESDKEITCKIGGICGSKEISSPEYSTIADALFDIDDQKHAEDFAERAIANARTGSSLDRSLAHQVAGMVFFGSGDIDRGTEYYKMALHEFENPNERWVFASNASVELEWVKTAVSVRQCDVALLHWACLNGLIPQMLGNDREDITKKMSKFNIVESVNQCNPDRKIAPDVRQCFEPVLRQ